MSLEKNPEAYKRPKSPREAVESGLTFDVSKGRLKMLAEHFSPEFELNVRHSISLARCYRSIFSCIKDQNV
jgi:hypothetical protein